MCIIIIQYQTADPPSPSRRRRTTRTKTRTRRNRQTKNSNLLDSCTNQPKGRRSRGREIKLKEDVSGTSSKTCVNERCFRNCSTTVSVAVRARTRQEPEPRAKRRSNEGDDVLKEAPRPDVTGPASPDFTKSGASNWTRHVSGTSLD